MGLPLHALLSIGGRPFRVVRPRDLMETFDPQSLIALSRLLELIGRPIGAPDDFMDHEPFGDERAPELIEGVVDPMMKNCTSYGFSSCVSTLERLRESLAKPGVLYGEVRKHVVQLQERLDDDFKNVYCLLFHGMEAKILTTNEPPFGDTVADRFPSTNYDAQEAIYCLVGLRNTACVFHLMRVMEVALEAIGKVAGVQILRREDRSWGNMLTEIDKKLAANKKSVDQDWIKRRGLLEMAYPAIEAAKRAWRDPTMHVEKKYTQEEAKRIFLYVSPFMLDLSNRINESGQFVEPYPAGLPAGAGPRP